MCRLKSHLLSHECVWRLVIFTACLLLILGATSLGFGMKLIEFADKPDITPVFAGIPMMIAGFLGLASGLCKKGWLVTAYGIGCAIISMLSIHMNYRFMGKELPSLPVYRDQCMEKPKVYNYCDKYVGTVALCGTAVLMLPFIIAALLSCVAAKRTLQKKNCCIIWFTCSKVEPSLPTYNVKLQRYKKRQKNNPVGLLSYKNTTSKGFVCEIPATRPTAEYLPRIPDFTDLAGRPETPGYPASVMLDYKNQNAQGYKTGEISKDFKARKEDYAPSKSKEQGLALIESGLQIENEFEAGVSHIQRRSKSNSVPRGIATSEVDLSLLEQDYLNRRSYLEEENEEETQKYYSRAAEEWIQKMVDNLHDSRSRLYAVSDDEELDEVPRRKKSSQKNDECSRKVSKESETQQDFSTSEGSPPENQSSDRKEKMDKPARKTSLKSKASIASATSPTVERQLSSKKDKNVVDRRKLSLDMKPIVAARRRKFGASSPSNMEEEPNYDNDLVSQSQTLDYNSQSECSTTDSQSETSISGNQSEASAASQLKSLRENSEDDAKKNVGSNIGHFGCKSLTPHGIVTPVGQPFPTGSLHFEFEKAVPTEHAQKNWVEFEGESEDKEKLLKGEMKRKDYEELTSYLM